MSFFSVIDAISLSWNIWSFVANPVIVLCFITSLACAYMLYAILVISFECLNTSSIFFILPDANIEFKYLIFCLLLSFTSNLICKSNALSRFSCVFCQNSSDFLPSFVVSTTTFAKTCASISFSISFIKSIPSEWIGFTKLNTLTSYPASINDFAVAL